MNNWKIKKAPREDDIIWSNFNRVTPYTVTKKLFVMLVLFIFICTVATPLNVILLTIDHFS